MAGTPCGAPGCAGVIEDGFCDTCGRPADGPGTAASTALSPATALSRQVARTGATAGRAA